MITLLTTTFSLKCICIFENGYLVSLFWEWHKNRTSFSQESWNESKKNHEISKNFLTLMSGAWKIHLDQLGPEDESSHKSRTLAPLFTNSISFSQESWDESNKVMKSQNISWSWGLGPRTTFKPLETRRHIHP